MSAPVDVAGFFVRTQQAIVAIGTFSLDDSSLTIGSEPARDFLAELLGESIEAQAFVKSLVMERNALKAALEAVIKIDVHGHQLQDRLQFSDPGRAILRQVDDALGRPRSLGGAA